MTAAVVTAWAACILPAPHESGFPRDLELSRHPHPVSAWDAVDNVLAAWNIDIPEGVRWERNGKWRFIRSADRGLTPWMFTRAPEWSGLWWCVVAAKDVPITSITGWPAQPAEDLTPPGGCRHCGLEKHGHFQRWTSEARWHGWTAPTDVQRLARMRARRTARLDAAGARS
jgi:hypothetical protein